MVIVIMKMVGEAGGQAFCRRWRGKQSSVVELSGAEIQELIDRLGSRDKKERAEAEQALLARQEECAGALVAILEEEAARRKRRRTNILRVVGVALALQLCMLILCWVNPLYSFHRSIAGQTFYFILRIFSHATVLLGIIGEASRRHVGVAGILGKIEDLRLVGPLICASEVNAEGKPVLTKLLNRLKASDADLINPEQRAILHRQLAATTQDWKDQGAAETAYILAILKALEQIGTKDSVKPVSQLAGAKPKTDAGCKIRDAARECLPFLQARAEQQEISQTLLRAACQTTPHEELVRAATFSRMEDTDQLLRASIGEARTDL